MLINLSEPVTLTPLQALGLVERCTRHILYGPEMLLTRSMTLTALRDARFRILAELPRAVRDEHKQGVL